MENNVIITKTFTTAKGSEITVVGTLELQKKIWSDGYEAIVPACEISVSVNVPVHGNQGGWVRELTTAEAKQVPAGMGYTHICGKLGLTTEQANIIKSVKSELEQSPAWQAKLSRIAQNERDEEAYRKEQAWIKKQQSF